MQKRKIKTNVVTNKIIQGIIIGRQKMLKDKSVKGEYVVYYENGKIKRETASALLMKEKKVYKNSK